MWESIQKQIIFLLYFFLFAFLHFSSPHTSILLLFLYPYSPGSKTGLKGKIPASYGEWLGSKYQGLDCMSTKFMDCLHVTLASLWQMFLLIRYLSLLPVHQKWGPRLDIFLSYAYEVVVRGNKESHLPTNFILNSPLHFYSPAHPQDPVSTLFLETWVIAVFLSFVWANYQN